MNIYEIRKQCPFEEVDYLRMMHLLKDYSEPRKKLQSFFKKKELIRVKKGLYVFGPKASNGPYSREHMANLLYGPSAISLEYALSFYQMIPERVEEVTSINIRRNKLFETPIGRFSYQYLSPKKYPIGMTQINLLGRNIMIASKEKALCDLLSLKTERLKNKTELKSHLFENLRIEQYHIQDLDLSLIETINLHYHNHNIKLLFNYLKGFER